MDELVSINQPPASLGPKKKVFIRTFGCQMNEYDSQKLYKILENRYEAVDAPEKADLVLLNTCSVRDRPEQKVYSLAGEIRELKKEKPDLLLGIGGCVAQQEGEQILKRSAAVDFVFGTHNLSLVPGLIDQRLKTGKSQVAVNYREEWEELPLGLSGGERVSALVSISRGCNKNCSYCIVPTTRGPEVSRSLDEILKEVRILVHKGAREIVLLGQTVNSWGKDFVQKQKFSSLLDAISAIEGVARIRFTSPHPQDIREDFFELLSTNPKICRGIHMPLQSGSDRVLKAMNRNYRMKRYFEIIEGLRAAAPDVSITTDLIVGFPGETEAEFEETLEAMRQARFDASYSFMFSPRPGTQAAQLVDDVTDAEKLRRLQKLQALQTELTNQALMSWVGKTTEVLIDGPSAYGVGKLQGRNSQGFVVNILDMDQAMFKAGDIVPVTIEAPSKFTLKGYVKPLVHLGH